MAYVIETARALNRAGNVLPIFGVIVYTAGHPHLKRVLRDGDYWIALDHVSGADWPVFALRSAASPTPRNHLRAMVALPPEAADPDEILTALELGPEVALPVLVVFTFTEGEIWRTALPLDDHSERSVYQQLHFYFEEIARALRGVAPDNRASAEGVFTAVNYQLKEIGDQCVVRRLYGVLKEIRSWIPL